LPEVRFEAPYCDCSGAIAEAFFFREAKNLLPALTADASLSGTAGLEECGLKMTTIVGIFDNARDLERSVERLARAGFEEAVYDETIVAEETSNVGTVFAPGSAPAIFWGNAKPDLPPKRAEHALHTVIQTFKAHLADYHLPSDAIEAYAVNFIHNGEFVLVKTSPERAEQAMEILRNCGAARVNRHD
jgi:hypothetical protein